MLDARTPLGFVQTNKLSAPVLARWWSSPNNAVRRIECLWSLAVGWEGHFLRGIWNWVTTVASSAFVYLFKMTRSHVARLECWNWTSIERSAARNSDFVDGTENVRPLFSWPAPLLGRPFCARVFGSQIRVEFASLSRWFVYQTCHWNASFTLRIHVLALCGFRGGSVRGNAASSIQECPKPTASVGFGTVTKTILLATPNKSISSVTATQVIFVDCCQQMLRHADSVGQWLRLHDAISVRSDNVLTVIGKQHVVLFWCIRTGHVFHLSIYCCSL